MWKRKDLKKLSRADLKDNYLQCVIVSLVVVAFMGSYGLVHSATESTTVQQAVPATTNLGILDEFVQNIFGNDITAMQDALAINDPRAGILASVVNNTTQAGSLVFGMLNIVNSTVFGDAILPSILLGVGALIYVLYWIFVQNIFVVGQHRFFLENRCYHATRFERLFFVYKLRRVWRVAKAMALRTIFTILWFFTIIGGPIMYYAYRMVPAILAENPDVLPMQALRLSRRMMRGQKWKAFKLDMSFLGWYLLSLFTFRLLEVLYITPYTLATNAELYMILREKLLAEDPGTTVWFNDRILEIPRSMEGKIEYPEEKYTIPYKSWSLVPNYMRSYSILDLVMLFFSFCVIGYVYEVIYFVIRDGVLVNRGTLHGPWLPIYGVGGVLTLLLLKRFAEKPVRVFFLSMLVCGVVEYFTAWALETFLHTKWWDYSGFFLNIQGRVCAEGLIVFGFACSLGIYVLSPALAELYGKIPKKTRIAVVSVLAAIFLGDVAFSAFNPNTAGVDPTAGG